MSRVPKRIACPETKAEGDIYVEGETTPIPYDTDIVSSEGCAIHLWMGTRSQDSKLLAAAVRVAHYNRDVVQVSYSTGEPIGYWTHQNMSI